MPKIDRYEPGSFCWSELATSDGPGSKRFYTGLFGWTARDNPMGPDMVYTTLQLGQGDVGALYPMGKEEAGRGVPPHWNSYVSVASADETAAKAKAKGGTVVAEPFDVMDFGRMAVLQDPTGAVLSIWEARSHIGATVDNEPGAHCWNECYTKDPAAAARFYTGVFGWKTKQDPATAEYTEFFRGERAVGGMIAIAKEWGPMPPHWLAYFAVTDCDAAVQKARSLGGAIRMPPKDIAKVGRFAILADPQGAGFAIIRLDATL